MHWYFSRYFYGKNDQVSASQVWSIIGRGHREKYFENKHDLDIAKTNPSQVKELAYKWRENDKIKEMIKTIYSDDMYPWPSGKAPWSVENQGTGYPPTYIKGGNFFGIKPDPDSRVDKGHFSQIKSGRIIKETSS